MLKTFYLWIVMVNISSFNQKQNKIPIEEIFYQPNLKVGVISLYFFVCDPEFIDINGIFLMNFSLTYCECNLCAHASSFNMFFPFILSRNLETLNPLSIFIVLDQSRIFRNSITIKNEFVVKMNYTFLSKHQNLKGQKKYQKHYFKRTLFI